jgi:hypothetical protein
LPNCEANIARLALFAQQTGRGGLPPPRPPPPAGTPMGRNRRPPYFFTNQKRDYGRVKLQMFRKRLLIYINSKVPFDESLPPLPSRRSGVPALLQAAKAGMLVRQFSLYSLFSIEVFTIREPFCTNHDPRLIHAIPIDNLTILMHSGNDCMLPTKFCFTPTIMFFNSFTLHELFSHSVLSAFVLMGFCNRANLSPLGPSRIRCC